MTASLKTPWGKFPLPLPGGTKARFLLRVAGPCAAEIAAPEAEPSSRPAFGAAAFFTDEGDLVAVPPFDRVAGNRFINCVGGAAVARRSHKPEVASSNLAPATSFTMEV